MELPLPRDQVFEFFCDAQNLQRITPPELNFRILTPLPITMTQGTLIEYQIGLFGIPLRWLTRIAEWNPPHQFVDEQLKGPYALWVHTHSFESTPKGCVIRDQVRYRLPLSLLGDLAHPLVRVQLKRIFAHRQHAVEKALLTQTPGVRAT